MTRRLPVSLSRIRLCMGRFGAHTAGIITTTTETTGSKRLADRVDVITGSSAGLGRAIALAMVKEDVKVVCSNLAPTAKVETRDEAVVPLAHIKRSEH
ncbi:MAG: hypothetical protein M1834_004275 [Cirrosporium novae-zelandiae]|nr:MAG: hypothetical protein M1834_004275 [Cirrosporium novae-zelandiae]